MQFESIARKNIVYEYRKPDDFSYGNGNLHDHFKEFDTLGDGSTQHTPSMFVYPVNALDALSSLAKHLTSNREQWADLDAFDWRELTSRDEVAFYASLKYNEDKTVYYNASERKKSASRSKQHDKRWEEIPSWADGGLDAIYSFVCKSYYSYLDRFRLLDQVRDLLSEISGYYSVDTEKHFGIDQTDWNNTRDAISIIGYVYASVRAADLAMRNMSCLENNYISRLDISEAA